MQQIEVPFCEVLKMRPKTRERSFLPEGRLEFTWKSLLLGYSNKPMSKLRPDIQGVDLEMASGKHEVHVYSVGKEETAF